MFALICDGISKNQCVQGLGEFQMTLFRDILIAKSSGPFLVLIKSEIVFGNVDPILLSLSPPLVSVISTAPSFSLVSLIISVQFPLDTSSPGVPSCLSSYFMFFLWQYVPHPGSCAHLYSQLHHHLNFYCCHLLTLKVCSSCQIPILVNGMLSIQELNPEMWETPYTFLSLTSYIKSITS